jgi:protein gp37
MSENTNIEWCDHTFNPVRGCEKVSPGCKNCYAARDAIRFPKIRGEWGCKGTRVVAVPGGWKQPLKWDKKAGDIIDLDHPTGDAPRPRVFSASLGDIFEDWKGELRFPADIAPEGWLPAFWDGTQLVRELSSLALTHGWRKATMDDMRTEFFRLVESTKNLDWLLLTKRPENVMRMVPENWKESFPDNVWMGTTGEDQQRADERIPELLKIPAKVRFLSCEPLLEKVDLRLACAGTHHGIGTIDCPRHLHHHHDYKCVGRNLHWIICGGESGSGHRPFNPDWARSLRDQCHSASVPFFMKQMGGARKPFPPIPGDLMIRQLPVRDVMEGKWEKIDHAGGEND